MTTAARLIEIAECVGDIYPGCAADLRALAAEIRPAWTRVKPTAAGVWWFKSDVDGFAYTVLLKNINGVLRLGTFDYGNDEFMSLADFHGQWCGPIPVPGEG
jgi:hypothetical protein